MKPTVLHHSDKLAQMTKEQEEQSKCLQVDPKIFDNMKTTQGITVSEINKKGLKVLLFFTSSVGCIHCRGTIHDIYDLQDELLKLNCVPVIAHEEDYETYDKFINSSEEHKKFASMLHVERKSFVKYFKLQHFELFSETYNFLLRGLSEISRISKLGYTNEMEYYVPGTKYIMFDSLGTEQILTAVFVIQNRKVISEYRKEHKFQRFDIARIIIDTDGNSIDVHKSIFECQLPKKKLKNVEDKLNSFKTSIFSSATPRSKKDLLQKQEPITKTQSFFGAFFGKTEEKPEEYLKLSEILSNERYLKYFKLFATSEYSVENVLFYEEVELYRKLEKDERGERADKIIELFFNEDSIYEINTSQRFIQQIKELKEQGNCDKELFDKALSDVINSNLTDTYQRFKFTEMYQEMKQKTKKKQYFLLQ